MLIDISQICVYYIKWREDIDRCTRVTRVSRSVNLVVDLLAVLSCRHDGKDSITWHTLPETALRKINMEQWLNNYHKKIKTELAQKDARLVELTENMVDNQLDIPSNLKTTQLMIEKEHLPSASMTWCCLAVVMFQVFFPAKTLKIGCFGDEPFLLEKHIFRGTLTSLIVSRSDRICRWGLWRIPPAFGTCSFLCLDLPRFFLSSFFWSGNKQGIDHAWNGMPKKV